MFVAKKQTKSAHMRFADEKVTYYVRIFIAELLALLTEKLVSC